MSDIADAVSGRSRPPRDRSPSFPSIPLAAAIERLTAFESYFRRHSAPTDKAGLAWGIKEKSSQAFQVLAALKAFGLIDYQRQGNTTEAAISEDGRTYLRAQQETTKREVLKRAALRPAPISKFWEIWGPDRPPDALCLDQLILKNGFSDNGAKGFLRVYDATIAFAALAGSDKSPSSEDTPKGEDEEDEFPPPSLKVGDYVQWTSGGIDQFKPPRRVTRMEGKYAFVEASLTGVPMAELTVVDAPAPPPIGAQAVKTSNSPNRPAGKDINILLLGSGRLQITAEVNKEGLATLRKMLDKYEEILDLMATPMNQFEPPAEAAESENQG